MVVQVPGRGVDGQLPCEAEVERLVIAPVHLQEAGTAKAAQLLCLAGAESPQCQLDERFTRPSFIDADERQSGHCLLVERQLAHAEAEHPKSNHRDLSEA
eukprot:CAMPEP_0182796460 /NCGR_PEP_ID=MMETSP0006_2-20121128/284_1 /TAXON_ID=97485 /ORGANISM="Prymnesium parvum, Strain Texoma1" /LENGTH=99 /DNA_ID=CAMNT_0024921423 /DNA_START=1030 /DNA_END=1329 /DNA_ORIENTATION=-